MNLLERNLLYRNELLKYFGSNNDTNHYIEGNCYILSKRVIDKLYTDPKIYNILNTDTSFDYNWVTFDYKIKGNILEVYKQFKERKLAPRNERSYDGYLEHVFERVILNFCDNYKILKVTENSNNNADNIVIFHCGNINIFKTIITKFSVLKKYRFIITYYDDNKYEQLVSLGLKIIELLKVKNKGTDCGPMLLSIKYLLQNNYLYDNNTIFYKIHTKKLSEWTYTLIYDMLNFESFQENNIPIIFGSDKYVFKDNKGINKKYIQDIVNRNESDKKIDNFYDSYYEEYTSNRDRVYENNNFIDLIPSLNFYKNYESDLKHHTNLDHWYQHGINEFHRKSNVNYINRYAEYKNYFIAGTIFGFNSQYLKLFKKYNLDFEYSILEEGYKNNVFLSKLHAWEYYFGLICSINRGNIIGIKKNKYNYYKV